MKVISAAVNKQKSVLPQQFKRAIGKGLVWANEAAEARKALWPLFFPLPFAAGILIYFGLSSEPTWSVVLLPFCIFVSLTLAAGVRFRSRFLKTGGKVGTGALCASADADNSAFMLFALIVITLVTAGVTAAKFETWRKSYPVLQKVVHYTSLSGQVEKISYLPSKGAQVLLKDLKVKKLAEERTPHSIRLKIWNPEGLKVGQRIMLAARLSPPSAPVSPDGFDFQRHAFFQKIGGYGFSYSTPEIIQNVQPGLTDSLRSKIQASARDLLPEAQAGVAVALLTGLKTSIPEEAREHLRNAGLAHLLAISGLHVGIVAGLIFFFSRFFMAAIPPLALRWPVKKIAAVLAFLAAAAYTCFVGAPVPTQRALIMTSLALLAIILDRSPLSLRLVAVASMGVLVLQPSSLTGASFQLSFAAVTALIAFYEGNREKMRTIHGRLQGKYRPLNWLLGIGLTTIIATLATAPYTLYHFQELALYSLLGNLLAMPIVVFWVMPMGVLTLLSALLGLELYPLPWMGAGIEAVLQAAKSTAQAPGSVLHVRQWPSAALPVLSISGLWLCLVRGKLKGVACAGVILTAVLIYNKPVPDIYVSDTGKLVAMRDEVTGVLSFSDRRKEKFVRRRWAYENGQIDHYPLFEENSSLYNCDNDACRTIIKGRKVSVVKNSYVLQEECRWADIIVAREPVFEKACRSRTVIDRFDVWRHGSHNVVIHSARKPAKDKGAETGVGGKTEYIEGVKIYTAVARQGLRPWATAPR